MSSYVSTRGGPPVSFAEALLTGLAPDGGLYVPASVPRFPEGARPSRTPSHTPGGEADERGHREPLSASADWSARHLLGDALPPDVRGAVVSDALSFPVPLRTLEEGLYVLELFHGPSLAFKDVGARFLARAVAAVSGTGTVLVATSGDTGGAVAAAFHGVPGTRVVTLFPLGGISERQRRQMTTLGGNVQAVGVAGTFDDCQCLAKEAFADPALRASAGLTSANSINVGRLLPQSFYYVEAAARLGWDETPATFVVPSGNLGNLCAGLLAHRAGMPAEGFVAACNTNRAFVDWLETGDDTPRPSHSTPSNAMDVGIPSNLERIRWLYGQDRNAVRRHVRAVSVDAEATLGTIRDVYERTGYLVDPHTAVGLRAARTLGLPREGPTVVLATAHPAKFPEVVGPATGVEPPLPPTLAARMEGREAWVEIEPHLDDLRSLLEETAP